MPISLQAPVLQVDANVIHKVDTTNPENLFSMWTVFARCADSVAQGRRLENLSWRLWNRETFCCESSISDAATSAPQRIEQPAQTSVSDDLPQLSGSVDSVADEEAVEFTSESAPVDILRPRIVRQDSCASNRSRRHITSDNLEKMVVSIVESKVPLNAPLPSITAAYPDPLPQTQKAVNPPELERSGSTTTESSPTKSSESASTSSLHAASPPTMATSQSRTTVVRGFTPAPSSMSRITSQPARGPSPSAIPEPNAAPAPKIVQPKVQKAKFALGGSSGEDSYSDGSLDTRKQPVPQIKKKVFQIGGSSEEDNSLKSAMNSGPHSLLTTQKTAPVHTQPVLPTPQIPAIVDNNEQSETDYIDESAIDDDDESSEWEDSLEDSRKSSVEEFEFKRVDSTANLTSRRSLITLMLAHDRSQNSGNNHSQSTSGLSRARSSLNGPQVVPAQSEPENPTLMMMRGARPAPMRPINEIPRSAAQPIMTADNGTTHEFPLTPRTTRRNMLSTELTESLRRHLLWERSQKTSTANAVLKRRHTSHDVANLKQYPERPYMNRDNDVNSSSWDQYFNREPFTGYHTQGW